MKTPNRLITIPISHYCEKARWALELANIPYQEERHLQGFHFLPVKRVTQNDSTPVLVTPEGVFDDSTLILKWVDSKMSAARRLYPENVRKEVEKLEEYFDEGLGVDGRLWMYTYYLDLIPDFVRLSRGHRVPWFELLAFPWVFPIIKPTFKRLLKMRPTSRTDTLLKVSRVLDEVAERLEAGGEFLVGDRFTAADLTFAALCAPVILPEVYGVTLPKLDELPVEMREQIKKWRAHPAGKFAQKIYDEYRGKPRG